MRKLYNSYCRSKDEYEKDDIIMNGLKLKLSKIITVEQNKNGDNYFNLKSSNLPHIERLLDKSGSENKDDSINSICCNPINDSFITAHADGSLRVWE